MLNHIDLVMYANILFSYAEKSSNSISNRSTESTRVEICPLQTVPECGQCRGNWGLFLHFGGWGLHCSLLHVLCLQHGISWILEKDTDLSPEAHRKHHGGWRQIPAGNCNSNCQPSSLIMPGLHQCTKCSKRTFTLRKLIHHIGLVHAHDPHFNISCGISNCQSASIILLGGMFIENSWKLSSFWTLRLCGCCVGNCYCLALMTITSMLTTSKLTMTGFYSVQEMSWTIKLSTHI